MQHCACHNHYHRWQQHLAPNPGLKCSSPPSHPAAYRLWRLDLNACLQQPPPHLPAAAAGTCRGLRGPEQSLPQVQHDALWLDKSAAAARPQNCPALPRAVLEDIPLHKDKPTTEEEASQCTQALSKQASVGNGHGCTP